MNARYAQRGEIWEYIQGSRQVRIVIISGDEYNNGAGAVPWGLVIERSAPSITGYHIPLTSDDPLSGATVIITRVLRCDPTGLRRNRGYVSDATMNAVERGLREFLSLP